MYSTLRLSQALRKAAYSDMKKQQIQERLQGANAAWQDMDTYTVCCYWKSHQCLISQIKNLQLIFVFFLTHNAFLKFKK